MNNFTLENQKDYISKEKNKKLRLGLYSSGNRWVKNTYNQISAVSLYKDAIVDCVAYNDKIYNFASLHGVKLEGTDKHIPREELFKRMAKNDVNVYATFTECAPMLPLESFDNIMSIKEKIDLCIENKEKIMKLYKEWKKNYDKQFEENVKTFLDMEK